MSAQGTVRRRLPLLAAGAAIVVVALVVGASTLLGVAPWRTPSGGDVPVPHFVDETTASGLAHTYDGDFEFAVGGGVAAFDCNDDGRPELYLAGGERPAELFRNDSPTGGSLRFAPMHDPATDLPNVNGAYPIDFDSDGLVDLVILRNGGNRLLKGLGNCRFQDVSTGNIQPDGRHTEAFSAMWEPGSSWPTFAFGNYVDPVAYADPNVTDTKAWCEANVVVPPNAARLGFGAPIDLHPSWCTLSMLFSDWSGQGRMDLRVSNDQHYYRPTDGEEQLWRMTPGDKPREYTEADGWQRVLVQGMGIASQDLTGDGLPEVYLTSQAANRLQTLADGPARPDYMDIGSKLGVNAEQPFAGGEHLPSTAWHPEFEDVNNDGRLDLFVSKGNVTNQPDYAQKDPSNLLLGLPDGTFREAADVAGILSFDRGRGAALADFNLDGRLDLVEVNYGAPTRIWRNTGAVDSSGGAVAGHWLALRVEQPKPNVDAIGAVVEVRSGDQVVLRRELTIGGGHAGGQLGWLHVGLGAATSAHVTVTWPGGETTDAGTLSANAFYVLGRGEPALLWAPAPEAPGATDAAALPGTGTGTGAE